jgi:hypothetical protein
MAVESTPVELTGRLAALADPVRLRLVGVLAGDGRCVCDCWVDYRLDDGGFAALWVQASAVGVPLPGEHVTTRPCGPACDDAEVRR